MIPGVKLSEWCRELRCSANLQLAIHAAFERGQCSLADMTTAEGSDRMWQAVKAEVERARAATPCRLDSNTNGEPVCAIHDADDAPPGPCRYREPTP